MHHTSTILALLFAGFLTACFFTIAECQDLGSGIWHVDYVQKCEKSIHKFKFDIKKSKINRTHDAYTARIVFDEPFENNYGIRCDVCKIVDGGCKAFQVLSHDNFVDFVNLYAKKNARAFFDLTGIPLELPVAVGEYEVNNFVFDYSELPEEGPYGKFCGTCFLIYNMEEVGCVEIYLDFVE